MLKRILVVLIVCVAVSSVFAQEAKLKEAKALYNNFQYENALRSYESIAGSSGNAEAMYMAAVIHERLMNIPRATVWAEQAVSKASAPQDEWIALYGKLLKINGEIDQAKEVFGRISNFKMKNRYVRGCDTAKYLLSHPEKWFLQNLVTNTEYKDFGPRYKEDGGLYYSSERRDIAGGAKEAEWHGEMQVDIFGVNGKSFKEMTSPYVVSGINTKFHESTPTYDALDKRMYFTRNNFIKGKKGRTDEGTVNLKIYSAAKSTTAWSDVKEFEFNSDEYSVAHPTIDKEGKRLFFVSDMPGGFGGRDIWVCKRVGDGWGKPVNLGNRVNTEDNESWPFISDKGILYFSSDGLPGIGGMDIFRSYESNGSWGKVSNLGSPLNTANDDFSVVINEDSETGYLTSNRSGGKGQDDIYAFTKKLEEDVPCVTLEGYVYEMVNGRETVVTDIEVVLIDESTQKAEYKDALEGVFDNCLKRSAPFTLIMKKDGYFTRTEKIKLFQPEKRKFEIRKAESEDGSEVKYEIKNIYYDLDKSFIKPQAAIELNKIVQLLKDNPGAEIELQSHTDCRASDAYNEKLSQRRAESAVKYIVEQGVARYRLKPRGYGERELYNHCADGVDCTEDEHQQNRRTEFKVLNFNNGSLSSVPAYESYLKGSARSTLTSKVDGNRGELGLIWKVQLGVFRDASGVDFSYLNDIGAVAKISSGEATIFTCGSFRTKNEADVALAKIRSRGVGDAFVVSFK